jgi:hypothetical protein
MASRRGCPFSCLLTEYKDRVAVEGSKQIPAHKKRAIGIPIARFCVSSAERGSRTPTPVRTHAPETCASTSSAISAVDRYCKKHEVIRVSHAFISRFAKERDKLLAPPRFAKAVPEVGLPAQENLCRFAPRFAKERDKLLAPPRFAKAVPEVGLEPTRCCHHWILSPARLPVPPLWLV